MGGRFLVPVDRRRAVGCLRQLSRQMQLGLGLALRRGLAVPLCRLCGIDRNSKSTFIHECQVPLRTWITLVGRFAFPEQGFLIVQWYAAAVKVYSPDLILGRRVALAGCFGEQTYRLFSVRL